MYKSIQCYPVNHPTVFNLVFRLKYTRWVEIGVAGNVASTSKVEKSQFQRMLSTVWESRAECNFRTSHKPTMPSSPMYKNKQEFFLLLQCAPAVRQAGRLKTKRIRALDLHHMD